MKVLHRCYLSRHRDIYSRKDVTVTTGEAVESEDNFDSMEGKMMVPRGELESLVGLLHHAAKVVAPGRSFLHGMIAFLKGIHQRNHHI